MAEPSEIREFLTARRDRLTPQQVGMPTYGRRRRVPGLRREEVALLAGISTEYYTRLERGNADGVSDEVLDAIAEALQLDEVEAAHLTALVRSARTRPGRARRPSSGTQQTQVGPGIQQVVDAMADIPVIVQNARMDVVAWNRLGAAFYCDLLASPQRPPNFARFIFLDSASRRFYRNWEDVTIQNVALLRKGAGVHPRDRAFSDLVGELATRSDRFAELWPQQCVQDYRSGSKLVHHPVVGDLDLTFEGMELASHPGLLLVAYTAALGSASAERLQLLASWAATRDAESAEIAGGAETAGTAETAWTARGNGRGTGRGAVLPTAGREELPG